MPNWLLYFFIIGTWGTSWLAIKLQLGEVDPRLSVAYRFLLAGVMLTTYCFLRKKPMRFSAPEHLRIFFLAIFLFSINYILIYSSSTYLPSGLESIIFSTLTFMNVFNSRVFLKQSVSRSVLFAILLGFIGVVVIFQSELQDFQASNGAVTGVTLGVLSAYVASLGNIVSAINQKRKLPVLQTTAIGMLYGGLLTLLISVVMGVEFKFLTTPTYIFSLLFLSVFASIVAFVSYLTLLGRIGPGRAGYCVLAFPVIAVFMSIIFEGYKLETSDAIGMGLILIGNYIVMFHPKVFRHKTDAAITASSQAS